MEDECKQAIMEEILKMFREVIQVDHSFLFSLGDKFFLNFLTFLDNLVQFNFSGNIKALAITILSYIYY